MRKNASGARVLCPPSEARSRLSAFNRHWNCDRSRQIPCWLASLLLHLLAVVVLGSLTVPVSRNRSVVSILLSFGQLDAQPDDESVELETSVVVARTGVRDERQVLSEQAASSQTATQSELTAPSAPAELPVARLVSPRDLIDDPRQVEKETRLGGTLPGAEPPGQSTMNQGGSTETRLVDARNKQHDDVVHRFIEFDVGRLQGAEGAKAKEDFERLGPEAIASLIRGLNRSANIHASCPVMVISFKLESMLRENPDPVLLRYALDNIGRQVPSRAPHRGRLQGLLSQLRHLHPTGSAPSVSMLSGSLQGRDRQQVLKAVAEIVAGRDKLIEYDRRQAAWPLIRLLTHRDAKLRAAAHDALVALAGGTDCGPDDDRRPANRLAAAGKWSLHFDAARYEDAAGSALKTAQHLDDAGKLDAARRYYAKVVREFPGSDAAEEAAELLNKPKVLAFK